MTAIDTNKIVAEAVAQCLADIAKYNENHDPDNGQFTEGGGSGGSSGGSGGGGSGGSASSFSDAEVTALRAYSGEKNYYSLNASLRSGHVPDSATRRGLDAAFSKATIADAMTVYRGIDSEGWSKAKTQFEVGNIIHDKAFVSTTTDKNISRKFGKFYIAEISVPAGFKAIRMDKSVSDYSHENEVLLNRGTKFKVVKVSKTATGGRRIKLEVVA